MIWTVLRIHLLTIRRDRVVQAMTFALPILFFSVFALVFGQQGKESTAKVKVAVVDEGGSGGLNGRLIRGLEQEGGLKVLKAYKPADAPPGAAERPLDRNRAIEQVRKGTVSVALIFPKDLRVGFAPPAEGAKAAAVEVHFDASDPVAPQMVQGLLQKVVMTSAGDVMAQDGIRQFETFAGGLTPGQRSAVDKWLPQLRQQIDEQAQGSSRVGTTTPEPEESRSAPPFSLVPIKMIDVLGEHKTGG